MATDNKGVEMVKVTITQNQLNQLEQLKDLESFNNDFKIYSKAIYDLFFSHIISKAHHLETTDMVEEEIYSIKKVIDFFNTILPHDTLTA